MQPSLNDRVYAMQRTSNTAFSERAMAEVTQGNRGPVPRLPPYDPSRRPHPTTAPPHRNSAAEAPPPPHRRAPPKRASLGRALRGFRYDLRHLDELPGRTRLQKVAYAATRGGRGWYLGGVLVVALVVFVLLYVIGRCVAGRGAGPDLPYIRIGSYSGS